MTGELFRLLYADGEGQDLRQIADGEDSAGAVRRAAQAGRRQGDQPEHGQEGAGNHVRHRRRSAGRSSSARGWPWSSDTGVIDEAIAEIFAANASELERYRGGEEKLFGFFMGQVMRATKGKADPQAAKARLAELING